MHSRATSKTSLFLMELIIVILFFSLASAVCVQLFAKSHLLSQENRKQNESIVWVQNISESFLASYDDTNALLTLFPGSILVDNCLTIYLDSDFETTEDANSSYTIKTTFSQSASMKYAKIVIWDRESSTKLQSLDLCKHIPERSRSHE